MPSLADLKAAHPEWCFKCGAYRGAVFGCCHKDFQHPLIAALIAAKEADEKRIAELEIAQGDLWIDRDDLRDLLTAEREAHEATRKQLEEADKALIYSVHDAHDPARWSSVKDSNAVSAANEALARQEARDKEPKP